MYIGTKSLELEVTSSYEGQLIAQLEGYGIFVGDFLYFLVIFIVSSSDNKFLGHIKFNQILHLAKVNYIEEVKVGKTSHKPGSQSIRQLPDFNLATV